MNTVIDRWLERLRQWRWNRLRAAGLRRTLRQIDQEVKNSPVVDLGLFRARRQIERRLAIMRHPSYRG